jgi:hypothetical protein
MTEIEKRFGTRRELAGFLTQHGFPISYQLLTELSMPSNFRGPVPSYWWGNRPIYCFEDALAWARSRARPVHPQQRQAEHPSRSA